MKLHSISFILLVIGGINWLLIGVANWGIGDLFGTMTIIPKIIYILVGLSALYEIFSHKGRCKECMGMKKEGMGNSGMGGQQM